MNTMIRPNDEAPQALYDLTYRMVDLLIKGVELSMVIHISDSFKASMECFDDNDDGKMRPSINLTVPFVNGINRHALKGLVIGETLIDDDNEIIFQSCIGYALLRNKRDNTAQHIDTSVMYSLMVARCIGEYVYEMDSYLRTGRFPTGSTGMELFMPSPKEVYVDVCMSTALSIILRSDLYQELRAIFNEIDGDLRVKGNSYSIINSNKTVKCALEFKTVEGNVAVISKFERSPFSTKGDGKYLFRSFEKENMKDDMIYKVNINYLMEHYGINSPDKIIKYFTNLGFTYISNINDYHVMIYNKNTAGKDFLTILNI